MLADKIFSKKLSLLSIDFKQPWWKLISMQKVLFTAITLLMALTHAFWYLTPFLIARLFESQSMFWCISFFILWILIDCGHTIARELNAIFQLQCIHSIYHNAHQHLLTIDPLYHVHRSSGAILGKIDRGARGYEDLLDQISLEFLPIIIGMMVMIIALAQQSLLLAAIIIAFFIMLIVCGYYFARFACKEWEYKFIESDDSFRTVAVENLAQINLIRSTFASDYMSNKLENKIAMNMKTEDDLWHSYIVSSFTINMLYLVSIFIVISVLAWQVYHGITSLTIALSLAIAYIQSTKNLIAITKQFRRYMRGWTAVTDLYSFMATFGKQTFPVLGESTLIKENATEISLSASSISFNYETAQLFNNNSLHITCSHDTSNKLYGIIGKSGSGKSTLLSILGGQLKPVNGSVMIDGNNIYSMNDATRRELIALQGQIASTVKGTIRYNLLFGMPENHGFTAEYLLNILDRVGLLSVLEAHKGLDTVLGEGGLNLSGGQRQRLNFAGLYLRAHYYKPSLILIDEPTSSLDEVSEASITHMIQELAQSAITLVIAHRLKTIENAAGLIDLSLLDANSEIQVYTAQELKKHSLYYNQLIHGTIRLDS